MKECTFYPLQFKPLLGVHVCLFTKFTMSEYTSTREGWQRTVEGMLIGPPSEAKHYVESIAVPSFYSTKDGVRLEYDAYISGIEKWRHKVTNWKPVV